MENLACEHIALLYITLAQSQSTATPSSQFVAYSQWPLLTAAIAGTGALCKLLHTVWKNEHRDVDSARLSLEQVASAYFVAIVLEEARRVFRIVDDHIPLALSQKDVANASLSRFDTFCQALRTIPPEELNDRGRYSKIILESFGRIISGSADQLIDAMSASGGNASNKILNPTLARFSLEGDGFLNFAGVAEFDYQNRRIEGQFRFIWTATGIFAFFGIIACLGVLPGVVLNVAITQSIAQWSLILGLLFGVLALCSFSLSYVAKRRLVGRAHKYGDPSSVAQFVQQRKAENGSNGH